MKTKLLFLTLALLATGGSLFAQGGPLTPAASSSGSITGNSSSCFAGVCVVLHMATSNVGFSVTVSGTWTGTLTVEQSGDNQATWSSVTTTTANTLFTSALTPGITDVRVRGSAAMTGAAVITITASGPATVVNSTGSSSSASPQAPAMAFYLSNACATGTLGTNGQCFNTFANTQQFNDASWSNASNVITFNSTHFGAGQAIVNPTGMSVMGSRTCSGDTTQAIATAGAIVNSGTASPTVTGFTGTTLTISATPLNTQALVITAPIGGCIVIGTPDDTAAASLWTALAAAPQCPKVFLAASNYWFKTPPEFLWDNPPACINIGPALGGAPGNPGFGTTTLPAGFEVEGRGTGNTAIYLDTIFPNGDACTHSPTPSAVGTHTGGCFTVPVMGAWRDFRIDGAGQGGTAGGALAGKTLIYMAVAKMKDFLCLNYGGYSGTTSIGIELSFLNQLDIVNNSGCGDVGIFVDSGVSGNVLNRVIVESSAFNALAIFGASGSNEPNVICYYCNFAAANSSTLSPNAVVQNRGGKLKMFGGRIYTNNGNSGANTNNGLSGYLCQTTSGCDLYAEGVTFTDGSGGGSNTNGGILCTIACTNTLINSILKSQSSGSDYTDVANSVLNDLGGNTATPRFTVTGSITGDASIAGTTITSAKLVLSAGWGTTAAWTALTGQTRLVQGTITASGTGQAANPTIVYTFPTPFWSTSNLICSATQVGGTQAAVANPFVPSAVTATGVTFTYQGTPVAANTFVVQISCGVK